MTGISPTILDPPRLIQFSLSAPSDARKVVHTYKLDIGEVEVRLFITFVFHVIPMLGLPPDPALVACG